MSCHAHVKYEHSEKNWLQSHSSRFFMEKYLQVSEWLIFNELRILRQLGSTNCRKILRLKTETTKAKSIAILLRIKTITNTVTIIKNIPERRGHRKKYPDFFLVLLLFLVLFCFYPLVSYQSLSLVEPQFKVSCKECPGDATSRGQPAWIQSKGLKCKW